ncbi:bifunctional nuclease domain-containing protein, partial [Kocuria rhizophila]
VEDTVFHAAISIDDATVVDARATDALALAARTGCPILCSRAVLDEAGLVLSPDGELREQAAESPGGAEAQVRVLRDFVVHEDPVVFQSCPPGADGVRLPRRHDLNRTGCL